MNEHHKFLTTGVRTGEGQKDMLKIETMIQTKGSFKEMVMGELISSSARQMKVISTQLGADIIPFVTEYSKDYQQQMQSFEIDLSRVDNLPRLFRYLISQIELKKSCEERINALSVLASLCQFDPNKSLIASYPGMLEVLDVRDIVKDEVKQITMIIFNLSKAVENKCIIAQQSQIMNLLTDTLSGTWGTRTCTQSQLHAIRALLNLSDVAENKMSIVTYRKGTLLQTVVYIAEDVLKTKASSSAMQTLKNLVCEDTIEMIIENCPGLCHSLSTLASKCPFRDISCKAAKTLQKLSLFINPAKCQHKELLVSLISLAVEPCLNLDETLIGMESLYHQAKFNESSSFMAQSARFTNFLYETLSSKDSCKRLHATEIISELSRHSEGARLLAKNDKLITRISSMIIQPNCTESLQQQAIKAILFMIKDQQAAISILDSDILSSLATFANSDSNNDQLKRVAIKTVILMTPLL